MVAADAYWALWYAESIMCPHGSNSGEVEYHIMSRITITVPLIAPSLNKFYSGMHWGARAKLANEWHEAVADAIPEGTSVAPPVKITTTSHHKGKRRRDVSNEFIANKLAEDGLVKAGLLPDDSDEYVVLHQVTAGDYGNEADSTDIVIEETQSHEARGA